MMIKRATNADIENDICLKKTKVKFNENINRLVVNLIWYLYQKACIGVDPNAK